jgi:hypothetical protein
VFECILHCPLYGVLGNGIHFGTAAEIASGGFHDLFPSSSGGDSVYGTRHNCLFNKGPLVVLRMLNLE